MFARLVGSRRAALFDDEEARKRIETTNQRLAQMQKQLEDRIATLEAQMKSQGLVELFNQVELLKADAARLRGQFEVLAHELDEAQKRQRDLYVDLDTRVRRLEAGPPPAAAALARCGPAPRSGAGRRRRTRPAPGDARPAPPRGRSPRLPPGPPAPDPTPAVRAAAAVRRAPARCAPPSSAPTTPRSTTSAAATTRPPSAASRVREGVSEEPARAVGAVLDRQRPVRAARLPRRDRRAAAAGRRSFRTARRSPTRCSTSARAVRAGRGRRVAPDARGTDREVSAVRGRGQGPQRLGQR